MDRREALKKLAIGGAIAAGGSVVVASNAVALTTSGPVIGIPAGPGETLPVVTPRVGRPPRPSVVDASTVSCSSGSLTTTYAWRLHSFNLARSTAYTQILVRNPTGTSTITQGPVGVKSWVNPDRNYYAGPNGMSLCKRAVGTLFAGTPFAFSFNIDSPLANGDRWAVDMQVSWDCGNGSRCHPGVPLLGNLAQQPHLHAVGLIQNVQHDDAGCARVNTCSRSAGKWPKTQGNDINPTTLPMDRREALKKLAIGGAIAAGGSLVVSSNAIAQTTSGVVPAGIPGDGQPLPGVTTTLSSGDRQLTFAAPQPPAGVTATYAWNIRRYTVSQPQVKGIKLTTGGRVIEQIGQPNCGSSGCVYYPGGATAVTETIFKNANA